eukprot:2757870-Rhodomonas_salina.1
MLCASLGHRVTVPGQVILCSYNFLGFPTRLSARLTRGVQQSLPMIARKWLIGETVAENLHC